jgi:hypothetical protein
MATAVQLEITVDEKGAVQGVRAFDASVKGTSASVHQLNDELSKTSAQANGLKQLEKEFTANEGSIRTVNAEVRSLQGSIFGDTRAASEFLATLPKIGEAMELAFPVFGATALVGVLVMGIQKIDEFAKKWLDVDTEVRKYATDAEKAAQQKLFDTASLETANSLLSQANAQINELERKKRDAGAAGPNGGVNQILAQSAYMGTYGVSAMPSSPPPAYFGHVDDKQLAAARVAADKASEVAAERLHALDEERLRTQTTINETGLRGYALNAQQDKDSVAAARLKLQWTQEQEKALEQITKHERELQIQSGVQAKDLIHPYTADPNAGKAEYDAAVAEADAKRRDADFSVGRQQAQELSEIRERALEAQLHGAALYEAQEAHAIDTLRFKDEDSIQFRNAIHAEFHAQEMKRYEEEQRAVSKREYEAGGAGFTGVAKIRFEGQARDRDILDNAAAGKYQSLNDAQRDRVSNWTATNAQILADEQAFTQKVNELVDQQTEHQLSGFAKIRAEVARQQDAFKADYEKEYGKPGSADYQSHAGQLSQGLSAITAGGAGQAADLARRNEQETEEIETQARAKLLSAEKQQTAAIEDEFEQRKAKYQDELNQQLISNDDYNRRVVAAGEEMQVELIDQARQAREKIAGEMKGLISAHPLQALEEAGSKFASQAGAAIIQRAATHFGVPGGAGQSRGSIFDRIAGLRNPDEHAEMPGMRGGAASGEMTLHSAVIYITGGATIAGGGGGFSGGGGAGGGFGGGFSNVWGGGGGPGFGGGPITSAPSGAAPPSVAGGISGGMSAPSGGSGAMGILHNVTGGIGTARSIASMIHPGGSSASSALEPQEVTLKDQIGGGSAPSAYSQSMLGGGMTASNMLGAAGAGVGLFSAFKTGGFGGTMGGAMSGAEMGMEVGGPIGAAIGAIGGAALGFFGGGEQARVWWLKNGRNRLQGDMLQFQQGGMDYASAYMDMEQLKYTASETLKKMGFTGERYYHDTVTGEISAAEAKLNREEKAGRSATPFSVAQFATGTPFVPRDGMAYLHAGEGVFSADQNERLTRSFEASSAAMHASYRDSMQGNAARVASQPAGNRYELHIHTIDDKSFTDRLMDNADGVRAAHNSSFAKYGGIADFAD